MSPEAPSSDLRSQPRAGESVERILVTGANGHVGRRLIRRLGSAAGRRAVRAVVRSERAADLLRALPEALRPEIDVIDYRDEDAVARAADDCSCIVHLVGILKESASARYGEAHETSSTAVARAAGKIGARRVVYLSILGSDPASSNACLASKGRAERILLERETPATVLRVPMVLGPGEIAAHALRARATARVALLVRGGASLEQPIDADDVVAAIEASLADESDADCVYDLAGPESLPHRELVERAARVLGRPGPRILPIPLGAARLLAGLAQRLLSNPPLTRAMLDVLEHDDAIDPEPARSALGITLTPLDETLGRCFAPGAGFPVNEPALSDESARPRPSWTKRLAPWLITAVCFAYLYTRIDAAAAREGQNVGGYLAGIFASVSWTRWLALMLPYSVLFLLVDTLVLWRVVNWFNAKIPYRDLLPVRASTYIISIVNEQVGKGAIALYLNRREGVPGWQLGSSMLFIMFCEFFYLLTWATIGVLLRWNDLPERLEPFRLIPWIALGGALVFAAVVTYFRSDRFASSELRERPLLHAFRQARAWQYGMILLLRSPALVAAAFVYSRVAGLFGVEATFLEMLSYAPLVFFGTLVPGPFRPVAIAMWTILFAQQEGQMAAFGFVQHNSFVLFNAAIGMLFLRRANRELFGSPVAEPSA